MTFRGAEIDGDGFLATVAAVEIGGGLLAFMLDEGRTPATGVIALGRFDLDDLGTQIGQRLPDPGACEDARKLDETAAVMADVFKGPAKFMRKGDEATISGPSRATS